MDDDVRAFWEAAEQRNEIMRLMAETWKRLAPLAPHSEEAVLDCICLALYREYRRLRETT